MTAVSLHEGDCLEVLPRLAAEGLLVDAVVTDPPYHLASIVKRFGKKGAAPAQHGTDGAFARASRGFMGEEWDGGDVAFRPETWAAVMAVMKPGAHLVAFAAPKNYDLLLAAIRGAGFEIRDSLLELVAQDSAVLRFMASLDEAQQDAFLRCIDDSGWGGPLAWVFGSGFPKNHDVALDFETALCERREYEPGKWGWFYRTDGAQMVRKPPFRSPDANQWAGWGTALKPAFEPIVLARKPLVEGSVAANVLGHGTGAINVDGCRVLTVDNLNGGAYAKSGSDRPDGSESWRYKRNGDAGEYHQPTGRYPANILHDGSPEVLAGFPSEAGAFAPVRGDEPSNIVNHVYGKRNRPGGVYHGDTGSAARFFYTAKADSTDRYGSRHPTVKPIDLMRWLVRLVTPPRGLVLDPFAGSGTTGMACLAEGMRAVLIESEARWCADIRARLDAWQGEGQHSAARKQAGRQADEDQSTALPLFGGGA